MIQQHFARFLHFLLMAATATAFTAVPTVHRPTAAATAAAAVTSLYMGGGRGVASSLVGKISTVEKVKGLLDNSEMVFTVPASSLTVAQTETLRRSLPENTTAKVVKNKLMIRALEGTEFDVVSSSPLLKGANMWFFIQDDIGASIKAYNAFVKAVGKMETHGINGGVMEGHVYDDKGVQAIGNLPSKQDLYARIAGSIKAVPTKVARVIKAPSSKLARAIKLATEEINK
jgi:large subunit ribosomal protein L10